MKSDTKDQKSVISGKTRILDKMIVAYACARSKGSFAHIELPDAVFKRFMTLVSNEVIQKNAKPFFGLIENLLDSAEKLEMVFARLTPQNIIDLFDPSVKDSLDPDPDGYHYIFSVVHAGYFKSNDGVRLARLNFLLDTLNNIQNEKNAALSSASSSDVKDDQKSSKKIFVLDQMLEHSSGLLDFLKLFLKYPQLFLKYVALVSDDALNKAIVQKGIFLSAVQNLSGKDFSILLSRLTKATFDQLVNKTVKGELELQSLSSAEEKAEFLHLDGLITAFPIFKQFGPNEGLLEASNEVGLSAFLARLDTTVINKLAVESRRFFWIIRLYKADNVKQAFCERLTPETRNIVALKREEFDRQNKTTKQFYFTLAA